MSIPLSSDRQIRDIAAQFLLEDGDERNLVAWVYALPLMVPPGRILPAVRKALESEPVVLENLSPNYRRKCRRRT